jgi:hypothetical protein
MEEVETHIFLTMRVDWRLFTSQHILRELIMLVWENTHKLKIMLKDQAPIVHLWNNREISSPSHRITGVQVSTRSKTLWRIIRIDSITDFQTQNLFRKQLETTHKSVFIKTLTSWIRLCTRVFSQVIKSCPNLILLIRLDKT